MEKTSKNEWETPQWLFDILDEEFAFTVDVCALPENAKCQKYYTPEDNGLAQDWSGETVWANPPYSPVSIMREWLLKAYDASLQGSVVVSLIPAKTDTNYFQNIAMQGEVRLIKGRLHFGNAKNTAQFGSAVVIFRPDGYKKIRSWDVSKKKQAS